MKKLAAVMAVVGGLAVWVPAARADEYSPDITGRHRHERTQTEPANNSGKKVRDRGEPAVSAEDQSKAKSDLAIAQETRKTAMAAQERSTNAHNGKTISANFQALYDSMSTAQKQTAGGAIRSHISAVEVSR